MNDQPSTTTPPPPASAPPLPADQVAPDELMGDFRGRPLVMIAVFTVIVHLVVIAVFSVGMLMSGAPAAELPDDERMANAVREATASLRDIADANKVDDEALIARFANGAPAPTATATSGSDDPAATGEGGATDPATDATTPPADSPGDEPLSDIERTLQQEQAGPTVPDLSAEGEDDLFAPE